MHITHRPGISASGDHYVLARRDRAITDGFTNFSTRIASRHIGEDAGYNAHKYYYRAGSRSFRSIR
jgi:hypothetical protein